MSLLLKIPLMPNTTDQIVGIELDGNPYNLRVLWNERFGYFSLSIYTADGEPVLVNIKMVKNYPLIGRFKNQLLPLDEFYFVQEKGTPKRPEYGDLGVTFELYYFEADPVATATPAHSAAAPDVIGTQWDSGFTEWDAGSTLWDQ